MQAVSIRVSSESAPRISLYERYRSVRIPSASSAAGFVELMAPVALTSSMPVGMLRVTSSVRRSDSCARSCATRCKRANSFSWVRSFSMTPCMDAAMNAEAFSVSGAGEVQFPLEAFDSSRMNFRTSKINPKMQNRRITRKTIAKVIPFGETGVGCGWSGPIIVNSLALSSHSEERLIPIYDRRAEKYHQHCRQTQEGAEWQLVFGILPSREDKQQAKNAAEHGAGKNRKQGALGTQKRACHQHHFHVAQAHTFAPAQPEIGLGDKPQQAAPDGGAEKPICKRDNRRGRREVEYVIREPGSRPIRRSCEQAQRQPQSEAGVVNDIREHPFAQVRKHKNNYDC